MGATQGVRLGVVGLGNIARQHVDHVRSGAVPGCEIGALCSRGDSHLPGELGVPHFRSVQELTASGTCDAVLVATPTCHHLEAGLCVLEAGLHLMMEKPLGLSVTQGEQLLARRRGGQVFALMLNQRTDPVFLAMRELIAGGAIGPLVRTHWTMTHWFRPEVYFQVSAWRATWRGEGGGLLLNQCIHNLDIFQWLCGMPATVQAFCRFGAHHDIEVEDEASAFFTYPGGATGTFVASTGEAPGVNRFDVIGDAGSLGFDGERLWLTQNTPPTSEYSRETRDMFGMPDSATRDVTPGRGGNQHATVLANFCAAITDGAPLIAPAAEGLDSLALANAMLLSTWEGGPVALPLDGARYQRALDERIGTSRLREPAALDVHIDMGASYR